MKSGMLARFAFAGGILISGSACQDAGAFAQMPPIAENARILQERKTPLDSMRRVWAKYGNNFSIFDPSRYMRDFAWKTGGKPEEFACVLFLRRRDILWVEPIRKDSIGVAVGKIAGQKNPECVAAILCGNGIADADAQALSAALGLPAFVVTDGDRGKRRIRAYLPEGEVKGAISARN